MTKTRSIALVSLALLLITTSFAQQQTPTTEVRNVKDVPHFARVNDRLYRGGQPSHKETLRALAAMGINTIINLRDDDDNSSTEAEDAKAAGLRYFNIPFKRMGRPHDADVARVMSLIDAKENGVVFVHCHRGSDRTGLVIALYRISHDGWTDHAAIDEAKHFGLGFWQVQMKDYISDYFRDHSHSTNATAKDKK